MGVGSAPAFVNVSHNAVVTSAATSVPATWLASVSAGNYLLMSCKTFRIGGGGSTVPISTPTGWTLLWDSGAVGFGASATSRVCFFAKIAVAGDSSAPTIPVSNGGGSYIIDVNATQYSGVDSVTQVDAITDSTAGTAAQVPAVTTTGANRTVVSWIIADDANGGSSVFTAAPPGETLRDNWNDGQTPTSVAISDQAVASASTVAARSFSEFAPNGTRRAAASIALTPVTTITPGGTKSPPGAVVAAIAQARNAERKASQEHGRPPEPGRPPDTGRRIRLDYLHKRGRP